tara:strand:+ start:76 stop:270 length:195 start_codon:yes stop_codon:yes gene_type:complete
MTSWGIIKAEMPDGSVEFQVSDGPRGKRSTSYDFDDLTEAKQMLEALRTMERLNSGRTMWEARQ